MDVTSVSQQLSVLFPRLPLQVIRDVVEHVVQSDAELQHQHPGLLAAVSVPERAASALFEISLTHREPQSVVSLEPPCARPVGPAQAAPQRVCEEVRAAIDEQLAELLLLSDEEFLLCVRVLSGLLERIENSPGDEKLRRVRVQNQKFQAAIGQHKAAMELLCMAGFADDEGESAEDAAVILCGDVLPVFRAVLEAVRCFYLNLAESANAVDTGVARTAPSRANVGEDALSRAALPPSVAPVDSRLARRTRSGRVSEAPTSRHAQPASSTAAGRREYIAALTERRLADPRGFRRDAEIGGQGNRAIGGNLAGRGQPPRTALSRPAKFFTLTDIGRMRIREEIANTPSYAAAYMKELSAQPAQDLGTLRRRELDLGYLSRKALDSTNAYRASKGLAPLVWDPQAASVAALHAAQMARYEAPFDHQGFEKRAAAVYHRAIGENLAMNQGDFDVAGVAVAGWIKSPGHERNLVGEYNFCGVGTAMSPLGVYFLTQLLVRR